MKMSRLYSKAGMPALLFCCHRSYGACRALFFGALGAGRKRRRNFEIVLLHVHIMYTGIVTCALARMVCWTVGIIESGSKSHQGD
jgi:hypothetical protein